MNLGRILQVRKGNKGSIKERKRKKRNKEFISLYKNIKLFLKNTVHVHWYYQNLLSPCQIVLSNLMPINKIFNILNNLHCCLSNRKPLNKATSGICNVSENSIKHYQYLLRT